MENRPDDKRKESGSWRTRLASLVAAIGVSLSLTAPAVSQANATASQPKSPSFEINSRRRFGKLVFRRTGQGNLKVADHWSHESHASHESHYSSHS